MSFIFTQPAPGILPANSVDFSEVETISANTLLGNNTGSDSVILELSTSNVATMLNLSQYAVGAASSIANSIPLFSDNNGKILVDNSGWVIVGSVLRTLANGNGQVGSNTTRVGEAWFKNVLNLDSLTASQILASDASKNLVSLDTATYPSLIELSYVKGVTSAIQTQLNAKVDSVSGTAPISSSGGTTPTISMPVATALADGYLSSANFTTFNNAAISVAAATALSTPSTLMARNGSGETALDGLSLDGSTSGAIKLQAAATTTSYTVKMPSAQGAASTFLQNDGSGNLSWSAVGGLPSQTGNADKMLVTDGTSASWVYPGLGAATNFPTTSVILGRGKPSSITGSGGQNTVLIGGTVGNAITTATDNVIIGAYTTGAALSTGTGNTLVGNNIQNLSTGNYNVAVGNNMYMASGSRTGTVQLGNGGSCFADYQVCIGQSYNVQGSGCVGIGYFAGNGTGDVYVGYAAQGNAAGNIAIGNTANAGSGANTTIVGSGSGKSSCSGANNTVVGKGSFNSASLTTAANNCIFGQGAATSLTTNSNSVIIGKSADVTDSGNGNTILGASALASGNNGVSIGNSANVSSTFRGSIAIGANSSTTAEQSISIGSESTATAIGQVSLGHNAGKNGSGANFSLFLGYYSTNRIGETDHVCFFGGQAQNNGQINTVYFSQGGEASSGVNLLPFTMTVTPATGTNENASSGTFTIAGAKGTGTGAGGDVIIATSPASGVSGTTRNSSVEMLRVLSSGNVKISNADLSIATLGKGLAIKSGTNAKIGTATFTAQNTVTVNTTAVTTNSLIFVTGQDGTDQFCVGNKVASTGPGTGSFDIVHTSGNTTAVVAWMIVEATP